MQTKTSALLLAAFCGFAVLASGSAAAREDTGLEGHWGGDRFHSKRAKNLQPN